MPLFHKTHYHYFCSFWMTGVSDPHLVDLGGATTGYSCRYAQRSRVPGTDCKNCKSSRTLIARRYDSNLDSRVGDSACTPSYYYSSTYARYQRSKFSYEMLL